VAVAVVGVDIVVFWALLAVVLGGKGRGGGSRMRWEVFAEEEEEGCGGGRREEGEEEDEGDSGQETGLKVRWDGAAQEARSLLAVAWSCSWSGRSPVNLA
jgi:hypothetical protein